MSSFLDDGRISIFHRQIYDWVKELYPNLPIDMEKLIPSSNQRVDIFVDLLNLAIECDGTFHDKPTSFYVKNEGQWKEQVRRDRKKEEDLANAGVKLVRVPYVHKFKNAQDLEAYIDSHPEPDIEYDPSIFEEAFDYHQKSLDFAKNIRKDNYSEYKENNKETLKLERKAQYQKSKAAQKEYMKTLKDK